ncbi:hypothetical protein B0T21DRAFT_205162 [Apiosordaria backusii]|uniref:SUZ domain-containing protein n=1 Tax=Apiosordaria backusii TaxID=314023 RepID=A0AA40EB66_9PEZI|nr:hypothetical protein B0T21DRAFT_205162 [Apiosordaria backusii]
MSKNRSQPPDAWDDDWESQADRLAKTEPTEPEPPQAPLTKAERRAKHAEEQRKLWESAEAPEEPAFLPIANTVPLATPFKAPMKLLSRRPNPQKTIIRDPVTGLEQLTIQDDDDEDQDTATQKPETPEERKERQRKELEEKQRRYQEARAKIFGDSNPSSGQSTPGTVTPPHGNEGGGGGGRGNHRGRGGRGRGNGRGGRDYSSTNTNNGRNNRQPPSQQPQQTADPSSSSRELFDPEYSPKPPSHTNPRRGNGPSQVPSRSHTPLREEDQITRQPRGPDGSGRGGFGFAKRGGTTKDG